MHAASTENRWVMESSRTLRLGTIFILYIAQGIPIGLFWFAIPAWMAANGANAADIAWVLGLTALPWSLKFFNGFLMDRYSFLAMGRRRAWVLGAQVMMVVIFLCAAFIQPAVDQVLLLGLLGLLGNAATTFQDVGVDGMAVDLLRENERAKGGGMMFGGQLIGTAAATAGTGWAIAELGASGAYLTAAAAVALVTVYLACVCERAGERTLPWKPGRAHAANLAVHTGRWWPVLRSTFSSLLRPASLFWMVLLLGKGSQYGVMTGVTPLIGTGEAGLSESEVTALSGTAQLIAGIVGLTLGSWLGDWLGAKRSSLMLLFVWVGFNTLMALSSPWWSSLGFVQFFIITWFSIDTLLTVVTIPIAMRLCDPRVAATQFAIYMALNNMGISLGALLLGLSDRLGGLASLFPLLIGANIIGILILLLVPFPRRQAVPAGQPASNP